MTDELMRKIGNWISGSLAFFKQKGASKKSVRLKAARTTGTSKVKARKGVKKAPARKSAASPAPRKGIAKRAVKKKTVATKPAPKKKVVKKKIAKKKAVVKKKTIPKKTARPIMKKAVRKGVRKKAVKKVAKKKTLKKKIGRVKVKRPATRYAKAESQEVYIGKVTHFFKRIKVCAIRVEKEELFVGDTIQIRGASTDLKMKIKSMQISQIPVESGRPGEEIGMLVKKRVRENDEVYRVK